MITESSLRTIVLASRNRKKTGEVADLLLPVGFAVIPVTEFPEVPEVEEDGTSFAENAGKKATEVALAIGQWVIGEDSGLKVDALGGAPGIYSARYSGPDATDQTNNAKLIEELKGVPDHQRGAGYVCSIALSDPQGNIRVAVEGTCRGRILSEAMGEGGFGYDPYFLIPEYHRTFGQLSSLVKHRLSHRARAFSKFIPLLQKLNIHGDENLTSGN
ncbi:MAG: RdgB/HAM1 family non-canonical purine NTP pyrophosphatase [Planctomycetaceae bacterium]|nr:RdgB/HAM1 family non-canonical purine NTP pyrophosphatase [Planctomycetaceae bacterium]